MGFTKAIELLQKPTELKGFADEFFNQSPFRKTELAKKEPLLKGETSPKISSERIKQSSSSDEQKASEGFLF